MQQNDEHDDNSGQDGQDASSDDDVKSSSASKTSSSSSDSDDDSDASEKPSKPAPRKPAAAPRGVNYGDIPEEFLRRSGRDRQQSEQLNMGESESSGDDEGFQDESSDESSDQDYAAPRRPAKKAAKGGNKALPKPKKKKADSEEDENMYSFDKDSDVEEDVFEDTFVKLEWNMERDGDKVEKVMDHRDLGDAELGDLVREYRVKWKNWSHLHNSYHSALELNKFVDGTQQITNYEKRLKKEAAKASALGYDEREDMAVRVEEAREAQAEWTIVERILDYRQGTPSEDNPKGDEYLVKWRGLDYDELSWEEYADIDKFQDEINAYKHRRKNSPVQPQGGIAAVRRENKYEELLEQPSFLKGGELREYQLKGLSWLARAWHQNKSPILADEMGLGKTIQTISFLGYLQYRLGIPGPFLVVIPLSTMGAWIREFAKWLPEMNVVSYSGNKVARENIQQREFYGKGSAHRTLQFNAMITTYEYVLKDAPVLGKIRWAALAVDEAHRLKNDQSQLYLALNGFSTDTRLLITGTPLQNSLRELWSLLYFLDGDKFGDFDDFEEEFQGIKSGDKQTVGKLHTQLKDYMLRRVKKDVEKSLPNKIEQILRVEMSAMQRRYYKWILQRNFDELNKGLTGGEKSTLSNIIMELKKCCNHPYLFDNAENPNEPNKSYTMIHASGKLALLDKLLLRLKKEGHRVLIFSQMVRMLDILSDYLLARNWKHQRLDGSTSHLKRQKAMEQFNAPDSPDFVFLLSTRAGGLGINLVSADTVIIYDSDWNPQNDLQAQSRAHRIGQTKTVSIYRLTTKDTVEDEILNRAKGKMVLNHLVISQAGKKDHSFTQKELAQITKFGASDLFKKSDNDEPDHDLDSILKKAEDVDFEAAAQNSNEDLLSAFAIADVSTLPDAAQEPAPEGVSWNDLAKEVKATQAPVQYQQIMHPIDQAKIKREEEDKARAESEKLLEEAEAKLKKRRNPQSRRGFGGQHKKAFVEAMGKFGASAGRVRLMMEYAKVEDAIVYEPEALAFAEQVVQACKHAIEHPEEKLPEDKDSDDDDDKPITGEEKKPEKKAPAVPKASIDGIVVNAPELLYKVHALTCLHEVLSEADNPLEVRMARMDPPKWAETIPGGWKQSEDNRVLVGVWTHGFGSWEAALREDASLGLADKIVSRSSKDREERQRLASKGKLERRTKQLLLDLLEDRGYDITQPYLKMVQQLARAPVKQVKLKAPKAPALKKPKPSKSTTVKDRLSKKLGIKQVRPKKEKKDKKEGMSAKAASKKLQKLCTNLMANSSEGKALITKLERTTTYDDPSKKLARTKAALDGIGKYIESYIRRNQKGAATSPLLYGVASPDLELGLWQVATSSEQLPESMRNPEKMRDYYKKLAGIPPGPVQDVSKKSKPSSVQPRPARPALKRPLSPGSRGARSYPGAQEERGVKRPHSSDPHDDRPQKKSTEAPRAPTRPLEDGELPERGQGGHHQHSGNHDRPRSPARHSHRDDDRDHRRDRRDHRDHSDRYHERHREPDRARGGDPPSHRGESSRPSNMNRAEYKRPPSYDRGGAGHHADHRDGGYRDRPRSPARASHHPPPLAPPGPPPRAPERVPGADAHGRQLTSYEE